HRRCDRRWYSDARCVHRRGWARRADRCRTCPVGHPYDSFRSNSSCVTRRRRRCGSGDRRTLDPAWLLMTHDEIIARLEEARARTFLLVEPLSEEDLKRQHDVLMSPVVWDLGHIAHFEDLWLVRNLEGPIEFSEMPGMFNPFENPRRVRGELDLPSLA